MTALLGLLSSFFTWCVTNLMTIVGYVSSDPVLVIMVVAMPVVGFAFGLLHRLIKM